MENHASRRVLFHRIFVLVLCLFLTAAAAVSMFTLNSYSITTTAEGRLNLLSEYNVVYSNMLSDALGDVLGYKKVYIIPETAAAAPEPDPDRFGDTKQGYDGLEAAISQAAADGLVSASDLLWGHNKYGAIADSVEYYQDSTILTIAWKQRIKGDMYNLCEVVIAHPSQFRRMLAGGEVGSGTLTTASVMADRANAVAAINGDYYSYRKRGVVVWDGSIYRNNPTHMDTCFIDENGDMLLMYWEDTPDDAGLAEYIEEHGISFSLSFGPILVYDGEMRMRLYERYYHTGQPEDNYARVAFGQLGKLHYLIATVDGGVEGEDGTTVEQVAKIMDEFGCQQAYCLDGGQTATLVFNNRIFNRVGYGNERDISDIIYFGSAMPS